MTNWPDHHALGDALRTERRRRHLSLRDLAEEVDVSFNTLSRVERGHLPERKNYERILNWLDAPGQGLFASAGQERSTPELIAKHLYTDVRLTPEHANRIMALITDLYTSLATPTPVFAVHLRSSQTFVPEVGNLLAGALQSMHAVLVEETK